MTFLQFMTEFPPASRGVAQIIRQTSPFMSRVPIRKIQGLLDRSGQLTFEGGVGVRSINAAFSASEPSNVTPIDERVCIAGAKVSIDNRLVSASGGAARANEIARRSRVLGRYIDWLIIRGRGLTDQKEITGLQYRLATVDTNLITNATNGATVSLAKVQATLDLVEDQGAGIFILMNRTMARGLKKDIIDNAGGANVADLVSEIPKLENAEIVVSGKDHAGAELLPFNETCGESSVCASMYCIAPGTDEDLTGMRIIMASNSIEIVDEGIRDSQKIDNVECAFGIGLYHPRCAARLQGIKAA